MIHFKQKVDSAEDWLLVFICLHLFLVNPFSEEAWLPYEDMGGVVLTKGIETEDWKYVHVCVLDHEADVTQTADGIDSVRLNLAPKDEVYEDFGNLFQGFKVDIFGSKARYNDRVEAFLVDHQLQVWFWFWKQTEALAWELVEYLVFLLQEVEQLGKTPMGYELFLKFVFVIQQTREGDNYHFLVDLVDLG